MPHYPVDPEAVYSFLHQHGQHRSSRALSGQDPTAQPLSYQQYSNYASSVMISEAERPRTRTRPRRAPSSSSGGTTQSSTFDPSDTISSVSTAPPSTTSRRRRHHDDRPLVPMPEERSSPLVCEFVRYSKCRAIFDPDDVEGWIKHNAREHLKKEYPAYSICWFCDEVVFPATSNSHDDRRHAYNDRMRHIAGHFHQGFTGRDMDADFFFLDHLNEKKLISRRAFEKAKGRTEVPQPSGMELHPAGWRPSRQTREETYLAEPSRERFRVRSNGQRVQL